MERIAGAAARWAEMRAGPDVIRGPPHERNGLRRLLGKIEEAPTAGVHARPHVLRRRHGQPDGPARPRSRRPRPGPAARAAMDFTGRPAKGMVFVDPAGLHGEALRQWVDAAAGYARDLPPKHPGTARTRRLSSRGTRSGSRVPAATGRLHSGPGLPFPRLSPGPALFTVWYSPRLAWGHAG